MNYEETIMFEPVSLKRHRHRKFGGTYDPSKKDKDDFIHCVKNLTELKMTKPIQCILYFYCKRPKTHYRSGKKQSELKPDAPKYNTNNKDLDNMVKFVLDAFNDKLYTDDCLIVDIQCKKMYSENLSGYIYAKFSEINQ